MKFILIIILYNFNPNAPDALMHKGFATAAECEAVLKKAMTETTVPAGHGMSGWCVEASDLVGAGKSI